MLELIEKFKLGSLNYYDFVGALEGAIDAGEFQDHDFVERFYHFWTPLEIIRAQPEMAVRAEDVNGYVRNMKAYLESILDGR
jgi:hypothetical protein